jgi:hypothetical protein
VYGRFSLTSFAGVALVVALLVALSFFASPLIAVIIAIPAALVGMVLMAGQRSASEREDRRRGPALTPEGRPTSPTGSRSRGAPASGEGEA